MPDFIIEKADDGLRLDVFLSQKTKFTRAKIKKLIDGGQTTVDQCLVNKNGLIVKNGMQITINIRNPQPLDVAAYDFPLNIVFEDEYFLVVDKPAGLVVHPAPGHYDDTLVNALKAKYDNLPSLGGQERAGIVHRLDMDTSGLILIAKSEEAIVYFSQLFQQHQIEKHYIALVKGRPANNYGRIEAPIGRHPKNRQKMSVNTKGREAITEYTVKEYYKNHALLDIKLLTGRTHQIRVHLAAIGHPVYGDCLYGQEEKNLTRHFLHAGYLLFTHPKSKKLMQFSSPLPKNLSDILKNTSL
ncbi:MAG: RluA family pseudouridine synthase [Chloroflexi bacterium]|nr:RluA family pseudouridine synthase [Chloroflexota bacterium]